MTSLVERHQGGAGGGVAIEVRGATVRLGGRTVLDGIDLDAHPGEITAILGPNGAGKTTLLRAIAGLVPLAGGGVHVAGIDVRRLGSTERARRLAYVPQRSLLAAALSVERVVQQGRYAHAAGLLAQPTATDRAVVAEAMETTDVVHLARRAFTELSSGEQQRVLLARALATEAPVVLLDEPAAALDVAHALELYELLRRLAAAGRCLCVVLHDLDDARRFTDRAALLRAGRLVASGASAAVVAPGPVREVYGVELIEGGALGFRLAPERPAHGAGGGAR